MLMNHQIYFGLYIWFLDFPCLFTSDGLLTIYTMSSHGQAIATPCTLVLPDKQCFTCHGHFRSAQPNKVKARVDVVCFPVKAVISSLLMTAVQHINLLATSVINSNFHFQIIIEWIANCGWVVEGIGICKQNFMGIQSSSSRFVFNGIHPPFRCYLYQIISWDLAPPFNMNMVRKNQRSAVRGWNHVLEPLAVATHIFRTE